MNEVSNFYFTKIKKPTEKEGGVIQERHSTQEESEGHRGTRPGWNRAEAPWPLLQEVK